MFLKRIEVNGFKSFCNKKDIIINKGITGVVGPNGSGKSNIADALRWVLGEQSSKNLRGSSMQDVIFNGTQSRSKKNYCEVCLIFDNSDMRIKTDYTEISVRRKMYRSGESEYYINNSGCRLKDILELFRDTGIGKEGYSIIGQGKIDELLTSKATQRRKVFEEAAGIMKYRVRKEEAERNLQKTKENITRMDDILSELSAQIEPLEKQMNEAKDYLCLRDRLKELEINLYLYQCDRTDERMAKLEAQILENEQEFKDITEQIAAKTAFVSDVKKQLQAVQEEIEQQNVALGQQMSEQERLRGQLNLMEEKEQTHVHTLHENAEKRDGLNASIEQSAQKLEEINGRISELNTVLDEKYAHILEMRQSAEKMAGRSGDVQSGIEDVKREVESARTALQTMSITLSEKQVKEEVLGQKLTEAEQQREKHDQYINEIKNTTQALEKEVKEYDERGAKLRNLMNESAQTAADLQNEKQAKSGKLAEIARRLSEDESRMKLLNDMREEYEGYFDSVRSLLKSAKEAPEVARKIKGVLAEIIEVPKKYETPIEVILGNALQNVVVETDTDAKDLIAHLRKHNLGRVTFLPTQALKVRYLQDEEKKCLDMDGVECIASEAIECGAEVRPAVDFLLGRTVIVRDMDSAVRVMRAADYAFRAVTMDGDFIKPGGVITGGSLKNTKTGLLSRKRMAQELEKNVAENRREFEQQNKKLAEIDPEIEKAQTAQKQALDELRSLEVRAAAAKQALKSAQQQLGDRDRIAAELNDNAQNLEQDIKNARQQIDKLQKDIIKARGEFDALTKKLAEMESAAAQSALETSAIKDNLSALELEQTQLNNQKNMLLNEAEHVRNAAAQAKQELHNMLRQNETLTAELKEITHQKAELRAQMDDILERVRQAGQDSQEKLDLRDRLSRQLEEAEQAAEQLSAQKSVLIESKYKLIAGKEKMEVSKETYQNKLWDDYGLTYANALAFKTEFAFQSSTREIDEIRGRIRDMGAVNPNAIEDYTRVRERFDNLTVQREDLIKAGDDLQIVIDNLLSSMKESFRAKFTQINENFKQVFQELFGGGYAQLELLDEEDIMECGVEIIAEPPGKKLQNIQLLSGGEKALTAIALLFAMLGINPSPICLLDEIDAPLDDANVIRFSEYLKKLSSDLQFIVITHRKPSMAICDTLYGVAMQEKGVSDIVSVQF